MDCSPPGSSIHGIFQARVLDWGAIAFSATDGHMNPNWEINIKIFFSGPEKTLEPYTEIYVKLFHVDTSTFEKWETTWGNNPIKMSSQLKPEREIKIKNQTWSDKGS